MVPVLANDTHEWSFAERNVSCLRCQRAARAEEPPMSDDQNPVVAPGPSRPPKIVDIGLDVNDLATMRSFWEATLGYVESRGKESYSYLVDPSGHGPHLFLQVVPEPRTEKN